MGERPESPPTHKRGPLAEFYLVASAVLTLTSGAFDE